MAKHIYLYIPIFGIDVDVSVYKNSKTQMLAEKRLVKKYGLDTPEIYPVRGMVMDTGIGDQYHVLFAGDELDLGVLTHECAHLTHYILKHHCMNRKDDKEIFSLLNEHLNHEIAKKLSKKGIKIA